MRKTLVSSRPYTVNIYVERNAIERALDDALKQLKAELLKRPPLTVTVSPAPDNEGEFILNSSQLDGEDTIT